MYDFTGQDLAIKFYTSITSNPTLKDLKRCSAALAHFSPDAIIAIGGGSTLDIAKAYKGFISSCLTFEEYQEEFVWVNVLILNDNCFVSQFQLLVPVVKLPPLQQYGMKKK